MSHFANKTPVSLVPCATYDESSLHESVRSATDPFGGLAQFVQPGQKVMLKPNMLAPAPADHPSITHPDFIIAVARLVQEIGGKPFIADSPAWGNMQQVARACGLDQKSAALGVPIVQLEKAVSVSGKLNGEVLRLKHGKDVRETEVVINLPKLKAHRQLGFTGATKNMYGSVPGRRKAMWHLRASQTDHHFARKLMHHYIFAKPHLTIMDAVTVMEGNGPRLGSPRHVGAILAGTDCVAIDTVCAEMLHVPDSHRLVLNAARDLGIGCTDLERIEILGSAIARFSLADFKLPVLIGTGFSPYRIIRGYLLNWFLTHGQSLESR